MRAAFLCRAAPPNSYKEKLRLPSKPRQIPINWVGGTGARADTAWRKRVPPFLLLFLLPNNAICAAVMHQFLANLLAQTLACELRAPVISSRSEAKMEDGTSRRRFRKATPCTDAGDHADRSPARSRKGRVGRMRLGFPQWCVCAEPRLLRVRSADPCAPRDRPPKLLFVQTENKGLSLSLSPSAPTRQLLRQQF